MELLDACAKLGALAPHLLDAEVRRSIETLAARAPGVEPIPDSDDAEELLYAVTDEVIRIGHEIGQMGCADDHILARRIVADLLRPLRERNLLDFANALGMLSSLLAGRGRHAEAVDALEECAHVLRPHLVLGVRHRGMYAHAVRDRGTSLVELGRVEEAVAANREALRHYERCVADDSSYALNLALTCQTQSGLLLEQGEHAEVLEIAELGVSWARVVAATGDDCRFNLAMMLRYRASALLRLDRLEEAVENGLKAAAVLREIAGHPVNDIQLALMLHLISDPLSALDRDDEALAVAAEAVELVERLDPEPALRALMLWTYGRRLLEHGRLMEAKDVYLAAVPGSEDFREGLAPELYRLAEILAGEGLLGEASSVLTVTARQYKLLAAADAGWAAPYAGLLGRLAELEFHRGHHEAALRLAERAVAAARNSGDRETIARAMGHLGSSLAGARRHEDAERAARDALELWQGLYEENPDAYLPTLAGAWNNLANKLRPLGRREDAVVAARKAVALYEQGDEPQHLANALNSLGAHLASLVLPEQARDAAAQAVTIYDRLVPGERRHLRDLAVALDNLSGYHAVLGELDEAWAAADRALTIRHQLWLLDPEAVEPYLLASARQASDHASQTGRFEEAAYANAIRVEVFEIREEAGVELAEALADLASSLTGTPRLREAAEAAERAESLAAVMPEVPGLHAFCVDRLAWCRAQLGRPDEAVRLARRGVALLEPTTGDDRDPHFPELGVLLCDLTGYLLACERPVEALDAATRAVAVRERLHARDPKRFGGDLAEALRRLGDALAALGRGQAAAEARLRAADLTGPVRDGAPAGETYEGCTAADLAREYDRLEGTAEHRPKISAALHALAETTAGLAIVPADGPDWLALSLSDLAGGLCLRGRPEDEAEALRVVVALREATEPMTEEAAGELALGVGRLGSALNRAGRSAEAAPASLRAATMLEGLVAAGHPGLRYFLAQAYEDAGHALSRLGEPEDAAARMCQAVETYDDLAADDPGCRDLLARASGALGDLLTGLGDLSGAAGAYERAVGLYRALLAEGRTAVRADLRRALISAAMTCDRAGDTAGSLTFIREAIGLLEQAVLVDADARPTLADLLEAAADGLAEVGDDENAAGVALHAADVARRLPEEDGGAVRTGRCLLLAGLATCRLGEIGEGLGLLRRAVSLLDAADGTDAMPDLGQALHTMAVMSSGDEAYDAAERAIACYRRLDRETPGTWRRALVLTLALLARRAAETERWRVVADAAEEAIPDLLENAPDDERAREVLPELLGDYRTVIIRLNIPDTRLAYAEAALRRLTETPVTTAG
ncbi:tetratricopeptide repeat protein [Sphaerimonospora thailandensis]|uniref:Tetratricopeptide repeat protein n=1 Tax=Sphaerimonospora thailandensis TaxID=795644 RepID=A0A8J3RDX9_9ACTN|nr:tetratricopeptide repeat protein [Sphaerimonospora thailandensis]GIH71994.1 hypothetical protein Mth01_42470 [Sphaerimonospora thailandensis]